MTAHQLKFYASKPHECGYLPDTEAVSLFADPDAPMDKATYSVLIQNGFRRSGNFVYRPHCESCDACIPVRVDAQQFGMNRSQRRCWKKNRDLQVVQSSRFLTTTHFDLYRRYIGLRHRGGGMDTSEYERFVSFIDADWGETICYEFYLSEQLVAVAITDVINDGLSAFYTYFDPQISRSRSLGRYAILWQIAQAKQRGLPWVYLGYWIKDCQKMNYKNEYQPLQMLEYGHWVNFEC